MPQSITPLIPGEMYHIWTHANGFENLFRYRGNYHVFLDRYRRYVVPVVETFAYCLMPNHLHLMIRVRKVAELQAFLKYQYKKSREEQFDGGFPGMVSLRFSHLFNSYTQSYNRWFNRKGSLFKPNFKRQRINTEDYTLCLLAYIHNNPVHHHFVDELGQWAFSSWHAYCSNKPTWLNRSEALSWFNDREEFVQWHYNMNSVWTGDIGDI